MKTTLPNASSRAFSLPELLMIVGAIGILAGVGLAVLSPTRDGVHSVKLRKDVESLNESIQVYVANGGSLDGATTVDAVLTKLKTRANVASTASVVGISGEMADERLDAEMMTSSEVASTAPRAIWNNNRQRFEFTTSGSDAVKRFFLNSSATAPDQGEQRETRLSFASSDNWVWDYTDHSLTSASGVVGVTTGSGSTTTYTSIPTSNAAELAPPTFSREPGLYNFYDFDLAVELVDPNPSGTSQLYYSVDGQLWKVYSGGEIMIGADETLTAYSVSLDPDNFSDSAHNDAHYGSTFTISGSAGGDFLNPEGPEGMVTNLVDGESGNYFSFGTAAGTPDPSWLLFNGAEFADVSANESFLLGTLDYYNGTILGGTQAVGVGLSIDLDFAGTQLDLDFAYNFDLISTANLETNTAEQNADFVKLEDLYSDVSVEIAGTSYSLILEFGETTEGGFSNIDEFHVLEGSAASGELYGRLVEIEDEDEEEES